MYVAFLFKRTLKKEKVQILQKLWCELFSFGKEQFLRNDIVNELRIKKHTYFRN